MALTLNGTTGLSGIVGSAATPALQGSDTNTGYYFGTDILGLSTGGNTRLYIKSDGKVGIGTNTPAEVLDVSGSIAVSGGLKVASHPVVGYASTLSSYATRLGSTGTSTLRYTQIYGGGNLIATCDGTNGNILLGHTSASGWQNSTTLQVLSTSSVAGITTCRYSNDYGGYGLTLARSKSNTLGAHGQVTSGQNIGHIQFVGSDGTAFRALGDITCAADGNVTSTSAEGKIIFKTSKSASVTPTQAMTIKANHNIEIHDGNIVFETAGNGIDFSAQTASSATDVTVNGELLDHFEEGTWTPVQPTVGWYSGAEIEGKYQRVGHWVTATFIVKFATNASAIQGLIDGLPFVSGGSGSAGRHGGAPTYTTDSNVQSFLVGNGQARIYIYNGSGSAIQCTSLDDDEIRGTVIYRVA